MKRNLFSALALCALSFSVINSEAQSANTSLSNLTAPTAIPVNLLPSATTRYSMGSSQYPWKDIFFNGVIYDNGERFIFGSTKTYNSYFGMRSGAVNTTGTHNTGVGYGALYFNAIGIGNSAVGYRALAGNGGNYNSAVGYEALFSNGDGVLGTALGYHAAYNNLEGNNNTAIGAVALYTNRSGNNNIAIGLSSMYHNFMGNNNLAIGINALVDNYNSSYNIAIGEQSGSYETQFATYLGINASSEWNLSNVTVLGYGAYASSSNQVVLGNTSVTSIGGQVNWTAFSDGRFKTNIKSDVPGLAFINQLNPVTYNLDANKIESAKQSTAKSRSGESVASKRVENAETAKALNEQSKVLYSGFVAQDVEKAAKNLNYDFSGVDAPKSKDGFYGLRYGDFVVPLVKAVQELSKENDSLKKKVEEIDDLKKQIQDLKELFNKLQNGNNQLSVLSGSLEQNAPNPYSGSSIIRYHVPQTAGTAKLVISDAKGAVLKTISLNNKGAGQVTLDSGALAAGTYNYSLYVDNKQVDTKQMVIAK